jgi:photosystem II stability/assembly factor-like uncharacterized protein
MKAKSNSPSIFTHFGLVSLLVAGATLVFANGSVLAAPDADTDNSEGSEPNDPRFDYIHNRAEWEWLMERSFPSKTPLDGATLSQRYREAAAQLDRLEGQAPQPQPPLTWTNIGPAHVDSTYCPGWGAINAGRTVSLAVDPGNASHWLIGSHNGGIWQTTNSGTTWSPRTDGQGTLQTDAIAFAPSNPTIVYASLTLSGLLKSTDGGNTWKLTHSDCGSGVDCFAGRGARAFVVSPSDPKVAVAGLETSFFPDAVCGIYLTTDGGAHWLQKKQQSASALVSDPTNFAKQYAAIGQQGGNAANGLYRSLDGGQNWQPISGPWGAGSNVGRISLALSPVGPQGSPAVLYVGIQVYDPVSQSWLGHIWKSTNPWAVPPTFDTELPFPDPGHKTRWARAMCIDRDNPNDLFIGEQYPWRYQASNQQWTYLLGCPPTGTHVDFFEMKWVGSDLVVTNDGGVFRTTDKGGTWQGLNTNLPIIEFYWGALHPTNVNFALAGAQDNASTFYTGSSSWYNKGDTGDGMSNVISVVDPNNDWLVSGYGGRIYRTTNAGLNWQSSGIGGAPFYFRMVGCSSADVVLAGTTKLLRSDNAFTGNQPTWTNNGPDLGPGNSVQAIEFAPSEACGTYAFAGGSQIRATTDNGGNWFNLNLTNPPLPNAVVTDLAFDPTNALRLYATFSGIDHGHLYVCDNITVSPPVWTEKPTGLNISHNAIAIDPSHASNLYVGTDVGLTISTDGGMTWTVLGTNLIKVQVNDILINRFYN